MHLLSSVCMQSHGYHIAFVAEKSINYLVLLDFQLKSLVSAISIVFKYTVLDNYLLYKTCLRISYLFLITSGQMIELSVFPRGVASLTFPGGQEFHIPQVFPQILINFSYFPQTLLIFFLILVLRVGELPTRGGPGYTTVPNTCVMVGVSVFFEVTIYFVYSYGRGTLCYGACQMLYTETSFEKLKPLKLA